MIILVSFFSLSVSAGEIHWQTDNGLISKTGCFMVAQSHSDTVNLSEYWVDCADNNIVEITTGTIIGKSIVTFGGFTGTQNLICPVETSIFGDSPKSFYMLLDCTTTTFNDGFENKSK